MTHDEFIKKLTKSGYSCVDFLQSLTEEERNMIESEDRFYLFFYLRADILNNHDDKKRLFYDVSCLGFVGETLAKDKDFVHDILNFACETACVYKNGCADRMFPSTGRVIVPIKGVECVNKDVRNVPSVAKVFDKMHKEGFIDDKAYNLNRVEKDSSDGRSL